MSSGSILSTSIPIRAVLSALLASLMFASMGVAVRYSSAELPFEMNVFLRSGFGLLFLMPWVIKFGIRNLATQRFRGHLFRCLAGLSAMYCFFFAIANLHLAEAVLLNYSSPLFIAVIALVWLGEKPTRKLVVAIATGFIGLCFILKPGMAIFQEAAWIGLLSAVLAALAMVSIRNLSRTEPTIRIVFYFTLISTLVSLIPLYWFWQTPQPLTLAVMACAGLTACFGQLLLTYSYTLAPAAQVGPFTYTSVVFAAIYGWVFWAEIPDVYTLIGGLLVITAGSMTLQRRSLPRLTEPD